ncbi:MAG TPA: Rieske 2Fe-2S domain-containing protein [Nitrososphaera sp.]|jgi:ubiquinol-cytochrome c reductase iron-sulfur subunit
MASGYYPATGRKASRRDFIKLMAAAGTVMTFTPFVDWGKFLPNNRLNVAGKAKIELTDGKPANIVTFPVNHSEVVIYPKTNDDSLNKEAFRTWLLIRLPAELGGETNDVSAFRLYSRICVHLWCIWQYQPKSKIGACPCHGSAYDPATGKAFQGPASLQ